MNLVQWRSIRGNTSVRLCKLTGLNQPSLSKILNGHNKASLKFAVRLEKGTGGEIRAEEICPEDAELIQYLRGTAVA